MKLPSSVTTTTVVVHVLFLECPPGELGGFDAVRSLSGGHGLPGGGDLCWGDLHMCGQLLPLSVLAEGEFPVVLVSESQFFSTS